MAHCLLLERIAADVTDRRLSGAAVASGSKLGRPILDRFELPRIRELEFASAGVSFHEEHSADAWKRL